MILLSGFLERKKFESQKNPIPEPPLIRWLNRKTHWKSSAQSGVISESRAMASTMGVLSVLCRRILMSDWWSTCARSIMSTKGRFCSASGSSEQGSKIREKSSLSRQQPACLIACSGMSSTNAFVFRYCLEEVIVLHKSCILHKSIVKQSSLNQQKRLFQPPQNKDHRNRD